MVALTLGVCLFLRQCKALTKTLDASPARKGPPLQAPKNPNA